MLVPTLYVCHQVEQSRREDERREAELWHMLRQDRSGARLESSSRKRRATGVTWLRTLLGRSGA
jgi:hypothetical protein